MGQRAVIRQQDQPFTVEIQPPHREGDGVGHGMEIGKRQRHEVGNYPVATDDAHALALPAMLCVCPRRQSEHCPQPMLISPTTRQPVQDLSSGDEDDSTHKLMAENATIAALVAGHQLQIGRANTRQTGTIKNASPGCGAGVG